MRKSGKWPQNTAIMADEETGEILEKKPVYVSKDLSINKHIK